MTDTVITTSPRKAGEKSREETTPGVTDTVRTTSPHKACEKSREETTLGMTDTARTPSSRNVANLARQARKRRSRGRRHPCRPVAGPHHRCRSHGHPPRLGASTDPRHIVPVAIFPDHWPV